MAAKYLFFDLDGTLVDSWRDLAVSTNYTLAQLNMPHESEERIRSFVGDGMAALLRRALDGKKGSEELLDQAIEIFREHYIKQCTELTTAYPGVPETLKTLQKRGCRMAVITNKPELFTWPILKALKIDHFFEDIIGGDTLPQRKPDPAAAFYLAKKWQIELDRQSCAMVGDHHTDLALASSSSIASIFCRWGFGNPADYTPDQAIDNFSQLLDLE